MQEIPLIGGRANLGSVVLIGDEVARPAHPQAPFVADFLRHLRQSVDFVPEPLGFDGLGRQRLSWIEGQAPTSPYPDWAWHEPLLVDLAQRQHQLHLAAEDYSPPIDAAWAVSGGNYFPDGAEGGLFCHNDLCMSNVIVDVDAGSVSGFVDFDYVAPTNRLFDIAVLARHWAPFGDPDGSDLTGVDRVGRFRIVCDVHRLDRDERTRVVELAIRFLDRARSNVRALADGGNEGFRRMIDQGYEATNLATVEWLNRNHSLLVAP